MKRFFTRSDIILIAVLSILSLGSIAAFRNVGLTGNHAIVEVNGKRMLDLPLDQDIRTSVDGPLGKTVVVVEAETVRIVESPCHDHICMNMGRIRYVGEALVCVPNRVFVTITGDEGGERRFDGVSE